MLAARGAGLAESLTITGRAARRAKRRRVPATTPAMGIEGRPQEHAGDLGSAECGESPQARASVLAAAATAVKREHQGGRQQRALARKQDDDGIHHVEWAVPSPRPRGLRSSACVSGSGRPSEPGDQRSDEHRSERLEPASPRALHGLDGERHEREEAERGKQRAGDEARGPFAGRARLTASQASATTA